MGAWDTGIFDNDNAADFSGSVEYCSDVQARQDLLMATMGAILERDIRDDEITEDYEYGHEVEHALAGAAYVADAKNGRHQFTDNSYAMMLVDKDRFQEDDAWDHIDVGTPSPELVQTAVKVVDKILRQMVRVGVGADWQEPSVQLLAALRE
jgi:hypothetical protein